MSGWLENQMEGVRAATGGSDAAAIAAGVLMLPGTPIAWTLDALTDGASTGQTRTPDDGPGPERF